MKKMHIALHNPDMNSRGRVAGHARTINAGYGYSQRQTLKRKRITSPSCTT